jgi:hypothetical protein
MAGAKKPGKQSQARRPTQARLAKSDRTRSIVMMRGSGLDVLIS